MTIAQRVAILGKKTTLLATAFVLAVSTLTAAVPFILSQKTSAAGPSTVEVRTGAEFAAAAANPEVKVISVKQSFTTSEKIVFSGRTVYIDGNANKITFASDARGWNGNYVLQAYQISLGIKNLTISGGDAALYANGSTVNLEGTVNVSGNEFGGIEVSQGAGVTKAAALNVGSATLVNTTEAANKPTVWVDKASSVNASVKGTFTTTTNPTSNQVKYYLSSANGIDAPVISTAPIYVGSAQVSAQATWTHNGNNVATFEYREYATLEQAQSDNAYWTPQSSADKRSQEVGHSWTGEKTLYYRVVAIDALGNRSPLSALGTVIVDKNAPTVELPANSGTTSGPTLDLKGTVTDNSGIAEYKYQILDADRNQLTGDIASQGYSRAGGTSDVVNGTLALVPVGELPSGTYTIRVWAFDKAGNRTGTKQAPHVTTFTIDKTAPVFSQASYSETNPTRGTVTVRVEATEELREAPEGWVFEQNSKTKLMRVVTQNEMSTAVYGYDVYGNRGSFNYAVANINTSVRGAIAPISTTTTSPAISGVIVYDVDGAPVEGLALDIYVDGVLYTRTTGANGTWSLLAGTVTVANNASHTVAVYPAGADTTSAAAFDTYTFRTSVTSAPLVPPASPTTPVLNQPQPVANPAPQPNGGLPLATFGAAQILGATQTPASTQGNAAVEGTSTENIAAQAVDTDSSDGSVLGLAWYWWLLIVAAIAAIIWGIVAALRRRQEA